MGIKRGAGIIPFARQEQKLHFLFHRTFSGRRAGLLVDFGGGSEAGESLEQTAAREFVEETEAMFLADDPRRADLKTLGESQISTVKNLIQQARLTHPDWSCSRQTKPGKTPREWRTYFIELPYKSLDRMNRLWEVNANHRFKKRRALIWIEPQTLIELFERQPQRLWNRLHELDGAVEVIRRIERRYRHSRI